MEQLTKEKDLLGAELLCGYNYFQVQTTLENSKLEQEQELVKLQEQRQTVCEQAIDRVNLSKISSTKRHYNSYIQDHKAGYKPYSRQERQYQKGYVRDKVLEFLNFLWGPVAIIACIVLFYLLSLLHVEDIFDNFWTGLFLWFIAIIVWVIQYGGCVIGALGILVYWAGITMGDMWESSFEWYKDFFLGTILGRILFWTTIGMIFFPIMFAGVFVAHIATTIFKIIVNPFAVVFGILRLIFPSGLKAQYKRDHPRLTIRQYAHKMDETKKNELFDQLIQMQRDKAIVQITQRIKEQQVVVDKCSMSISQFYTEEEQILKALTLVPILYWQKLAINRMLYFYINQHGDTAKQLIKLHEKEKVGVDLLATLPHLQVSLQKLAEEVEDTFIEVGAELEVVSTMEVNFQTQTFLHRANLDKIKDKTTRAYFVIVDLMHNIQSFLERSQSQDESETEQTIARKIK